VLFPYSKDSGKLELNGFSNADWCGDKVDRRSTCGYLFRFQNAPVSWCFKKKPVIALSTCEAEYVAGSLASCQANWLQSLISKMSIIEDITVMLKIKYKSTWLRTLLVMVRVNTLRQDFTFLEIKSSKES
jgi:hypothetical protein